MATKLQIWRAHNRWAWRNVGHRNGLYPWPAYSKCCLLPAFHSIIWLVQDLWTSTSGILWLRPLWILTDWLAAWKACPSYTGVPAEMGYFHYFVGLLHGSGAYQQCRLITLFYGIKPSLGYLGQLVGKVKVQCHPGYIHGQFIFVGHYLDGAQSLL